MNFQSTTSELEIPPKLQAKLRKLVRLTMRAKRDPRQNRERVKLLKSILNRLRPVQFRFLRAGLLMDLGNAYLGLPTGNREANLQQAIACYQQVLTVFTPEAAPLDYAVTQNSLGASYYESSTGDPAGNLQQAIACFREALRFFTPKATPFDYAGAQQNLGNAYRDLPTGDRLVNLQQAIACYRQALTVFTPEAAPLDYALTKSNLGVTYSELPTGDRSANLQQAIACYRQALQFHTPEKAPFQYAVTQALLGNAYRDLPSGDQEANLQQAIACYQEALKFHTLKAFPSEYAKTQNNLGIAYHRMPTGDRTANIHRAISCYRENLRFTTSEAAPLGYAATQHNMGFAFSDLPSGDQEANLQQAITCYQEALRFRTLETTPVGHLETSWNLGNLYFGLGQWEEAHMAYSTAILASEMLYQSAATEVSRQTVLGEAKNLFPNDTYCLVRLGHFNRALEQLENSKARALAEALAYDLIAIEYATPEDRNVFEALRNRIKALEAEARATGTHGSDTSLVRSFTGISNELRVARQELSETVNRIRGYVSEFMPDGLAFKSIAAAVPSDCPLVYLITTSQGSMALIVPPGVVTLSEEQTVWCDGFREDDLMELLWKKDADGQMVCSYLLGQMWGNSPILKAALEQALPIMGERLMGPVAESLWDLGCRKATLIPSGLLALLPLHAARYSTNGESHTFIGDFEVNYAPNARSLTACRQLAKAVSDRPPSLFAVADPPHTRTPRLVFARAEVEGFLPFFPAEACRPLFEEQATREAAFEAALGHTYLHYACHGFFDFSEPLQSALLLAGESRLTLKDILHKTDLTGTRLAILSACQTAITDVLKAPNEMVGFPAGFMRAGVPGVVATLWPVADISTAVLLRKFYQCHFEEALEPAIALHKAQKWLRDATASEMHLTDFYERLYQASGHRDRNAFRWIRYFRSNSEVKPFEHPYYWAGFIFSGV